METQRMAKPAQGIASAPETAALAKDFITSGTEKLYREMHESIIKESAVNGYLAIQENHRNIDESYRFLCDIARIAGLKEPENSTGAKRSELEKIMNTPDYKEFICLYNVFTASSYDDAVKDILLNGNRKKEAGAAFMYHTFRINTDEQTQCMAYAEYLKAFGGSKELAKELFSRWEYCTSNGSTDVSEKYFELTGKCCENNPDFLGKSESSLLRADSDEIRIAAHYLTVERAVTQDLSEDSIMLLIRSLEKTNSKDYCEYTKNCISNCIITVYTRLSDASAEKVSPEVWDMLAENLLSTEAVDRSFMFGCIFNAWTGKAKDKEFKSADACFTALHKLSSAVTADGNIITAEQLEFAAKGNGSNGARLVSLRQSMDSYSHVNMVVEELSKINYSDECTYVQRLANGCAEEMYRLIDKCCVMNHHKSMYPLRDFTKNKKEYADVYKKADAYIKERERKEKAAAASKPAPNRNNSTASKPASNNPVRIDNKQQLKDLNRNPKDKKAEQTMGPVYLPQMIMGFILISLGFTAMGEFIEYPSLFPVWAVLGIAFLITTFVSVYNSYNKRKLAPTTLMIIVESVLNIACFAINTYMNSGKTPMGATLIFLVILIGNIVIKAKCRE